MGTKCWQSILRGGLLFALMLSASFYLRAQFATPDYVSQPRFWPTQTSYPRNEYAGAAACGSCHRAIFDSQQETAMARTAMRAGESDVLGSHPHLSFTKGTYHYDILDLGGKIDYVAGDGRQTKSAPLAWAFGTDRVAQSYLFKKEEASHGGKEEGRKDGEFYEARVTYFRLLDALDFTPGRALNSALDIEEAMDRQVGRAEVYRCFSCHTTASGMEASFDEQRLIPGVSCEACHGPGRDHIAAMQGAPSAHSRAASRAENTAARIFNPKKLTPEESVDFCGACHGSYWDVSLTNSSGAGNVRFQPYRLEQSKCWNKGDARLTCTACHDPHKEVDSNASDYDHVCLSCHLNTISKSAVVDTSHPGAACPVARKNCTSCHMPQVDVPGMHSSFPDHRIRIARAGDPFPD